MKLTAGTITTDKTRAVFHALATATDKSRRVMRMSEDSVITPDDAAAQINALISTLNLTLAEIHDPAPPVPEKLSADLAPYRYFTNGNTFWKMPPSGAGFVRPASGSEWYDSICGLPDMDLSPPVKECSQEEAEP